MIQKKKKVNVKRIKKDDTKNFNSQIKWSVDTLFTLNKEYSKKNSLIDDGESIFLQVTLMKIPQVDEMVKRRITLKHPPYAGNPEVCFIVRDCIRKDRIKRTNDEMIDYTIECYEDHFKKQKITGISTILPYRQLKTEYDTYELRRKLVNRFDVFLCSSFLNSQDYFFKCLGKPFISKNKFPISVILPPLNSEYDPKGNRRVQAAISSTVFRIKECSDNYCIKVGNTLNKKKAIKENMKVVLDKIINSELIPGGFRNVKLIGLKSDRSKIVPLYISMDSGRKVPVPYVEPNFPVKESVEGELSTLPGKKVTVLPNGQIFITKMEDASDDENLEDEAGDEDDDGYEDEDGNEEDEEDDENVYNQMINNSRKEVIKKKGKRSREEVSDDEDVEEAIESAEQHYLSNWNENLESSEDEQAKDGKSKKGTKKKQNLTGKRANLKKKDSPAAKKNDMKPTKKTKKEVTSESPAKKLKKEVTLESPAKKLKKEVAPPTKKLKKGDTKVKVNAKNGKLGKEKKRGIEKLAKNMETLDGKPGKKKKVKKDEIADGKLGKRKTMSDAKLTKKVKRGETKMNGIEKSSLKKKKGKKMKS